MRAAVRMVPVAGTETDSHLIDAFIGDPDGPTLIAIGSLHGNEPAGAEALHSVAMSLADTNAKLRGRVYLIKGNTRALKNNVRYIDHDLNRAWTADNLSSLGTQFRATPEGAEMGELEALLDSILITARDEVYVIDLHSTSAAGSPFLTVGDTLRNRHFTAKFPIRTLLGIEEQLEGTLLEYLNNAGAVTLGFEGGSHLSPQTVENHTAFAFLALVNSGILSPEEIPNFEDHRLRLAAGVSHARFFEVLHRQKVSTTDSFVMKPGFFNFEPIVKGQLLAHDVRGDVLAPLTGVLLMPLYQKLGEDGFFVGREIAAFWLRVSEIVRRLRLYSLMPWLPGVARDPNDPDTLIVNTRIARIVPLQVFHLLGFRKRRWAGHKLIVSRRRHDTDSPFASRG